MAAAEFQDTSWRLPDPPEKGGGITHQHLHFGLLFLLQREVLRRECTHLPQGRKERGRLILLVFRFPVGFSARFNPRKCFRKY